MTGQLFKARAIRLARLLLLGGLVWALAGCSSLPAMPSFSSLLPNIRDADSFLGVVTPYRMDIVQGNVVTKEQAALIKPGLSRNQVRDVLGSPMLADMFHTDRWDYAFTIRRKGTEAQRRSVVVYFKDDKVERLEAPDLPTEREFVASISRPPKSTAVPVLELTPEQRQALPKPAKTEAPATAEPTGATRTYPPLEPT